MSEDFEQDITDLFSDKIKESDEFCEDIWSSLANVIWKHESKIEYACTFRYAGGLIAGIREKGNYMDWYCSGPYNTVSDEISKAMKNIGWTHHEYE